MSLTLAVAINVIADITLIGILAYVMSLPSRLSPHRPAELQLQTGGPITSPARLPQPELAIAA